MKIKGGNLEALGDRLLKMRKRAGKTQKEMGARLEIAAQTWREYEKDVSEIGLSDLIKAARFCKVNPVRIFASFFMIRTMVMKAKKMGIKTKMMKTKMPLN
ncbi:MAG: helix-turn-helix transcriptional regulator [Algicola sp.]|nr:helix-turn-helix transcriptional regulator [Algicola sp.]